MTIFLIPLDTFNLKSNEAIPSRISLLSQRNDLIGVNRVASFTKGIGGFPAYAKGLGYAGKALVFGLRHRKDFDLIYCFEAFYAAVGIVISLMTGKPCVQDTASVTSEWVRRVKPSKFFTSAVLTAEKIVKKFAKMTIVLSESDRQAYTKQGIEHDKIAVIPRPAQLTLSDEVAFGKEALRERLGLEENKKVLIFTGKREYPPNMEAANWINQELAPAISDRCNNAQILMTGTGQRPQPTHPMITFAGYVPNFFEYIHAADIFIAPIEIASGRLTKVFDSMSCAKPAVVMESATNGIPELHDGYNAMIAKDRGEFIEKTIYLLEHLDGAQKIGKRARETLEEHYAWDKWEEKINEVLHWCIATSRKGAK